MAGETPAGPGFDRTEQGGESVLDLHRAQLRERPVPEEGSEPVPWWLWAIAAVAVFVGGYYLGRYSAGFSADAHAAPKTASGPTALAPGAPQGTAAIADLAKEGEGVFTTSCAGCHQATGAGIPGAFPPLAGSPWVLGSDSVVVKIVLLGLQGPVQVGGSTFQGQMPSWRATLSDRQIAAVISYVRSGWGNKAGPVTEELVASLRQSLAQRDKAWVVDELH